MTRLSQELARAGVAHDVLDLNLEGLLWLMERGSCLDIVGEWSRRARKNLKGNLALIRSISACQSFDRYSRVVGELDHLLADASPEGYAVSLANLINDHLSPLRSTDLIQVSEKPEENPFFDHFREKLDLVCSDMDKGVIGFSITYLGQALTAFAMMGYIHRKWPGIKIVAGGGLISSWMAAQDLNNIFAGFIVRFVRGPGEQPLKEMCLDTLKGQPQGDSELDANRPSDSPIIPGAWRRSKTDSNAYMYLAPSPVLPFSASSGCYWGKCMFCPERAEGNRYQPLPVDAALGDLKGQVSRFRPGLVHLTDNALSPALLRGIAANPPGAPWYGFARISEELADECFCRDLKKAGCVMVKLGVESGSDAVLDSMCKGFSTDLASRVLNALHKAGIQTYLYMLFGTPWEKEADARATLDFCARHSELIGFLNLALFNLPARGPDTEKLKTRPFYKADLGLYVDFDHPHGWDRRKVRAFIGREFSRHPLIAPIIRRDPPVFTSNHAPFFSCQYMDAARPVAGGFT